MFYTFGQSSQMSLCLWAAEAIDLITNKAITIMNALTSGMEFHTRTHTELYIKKPIYKQVKTTPTLNILQHVLISHLYLIRVFFYTNESSLYCSTIILPHVVILIHVIRSSRVAI